MFIECGGSLQFSISNNNGENIKNMSNMFINSKYTNLDIANLKVNNS